MPLVSIVVHNVHGPRVLQQPYKNADSPRCFSMLQTLRALAWCPRHVSRAAAAVSYIQSTAIYFKGCDYRIVATDTLRLRFWDAPPCFPIARVFHAMNWWACALNKRLHELLSGGGVLWLVSEASLNNVLKHTCVWCWKKREVGINYWSSNGNLLSLCPRIRYVAQKPSDQRQAHTFTISNKYTHLPFSKTAHSFMTRTNWQAKSIMVKFYLSLSFATAVTVVSIIIMATHIWGSLY